MIALRQFFTIAVAAALAAGPVCAQDWARSFRELRDLRLSALSSQFTTHQFSSYDRTMGNKDWGNFLRVEGNTRVLAEMEGPGEIVRIWSANPSGTLSIYVDGQREPYISGPFADVFRGMVRPFDQPLATESSGGFISYFPIPYNTSARVEAVDAQDFYYHVEYRTFASDVPTPPDFQNDAVQQSVRSTQQIWGAPETMLPYLDEPDPIIARGSSREIKKTLRVRPGQSARLVEEDRPGYLQEIRLKLPANSSLALRRTRLAARWDDSPQMAVDVPVLDFFGSFFGLQEFKSLPLGSLEDGWYYVRWPMPFKKSARMSLINQSDTTLNIDAVITIVSGSPSPEALYYRASYNDEVTTFGEPYTILEASGQGQFVGVTMNMLGTSGLSFLEGDEMIAVDGRSVEDFFGTGTEDYFNSGWYFRGGAVDQPQHGAIVKDDAGSRVSVYRFHTTDRIPFQRSFRFDMEHGGVNDAPYSKYATVAHWYSRLPGDASTPPVRASQLRLPRKALAVPQGSVELAGLTHAVEGEGQVFVDDWGSISQTIDGGPILLYRPSKAGETLSIVIEAPYDDVYRPTLWSGRGPGLGNVRFTIDGVDVGHVDLYSAEPNQPAPLQLDQIPLTAGKHALEVRVLEKNRASAGNTVILSHLEMNSAGPLVKQWSLLGPFKAESYEEQQAGIDFEYIEEDGGPEIPVGAAPQLVSSDDGRFELTGETSVWYAFATVHATEDLETQLLVGSDDNVRVWLNGELVHSNNAFRGLVLDSDAVNVSLNEGENTLVLKVYNGGGPAGLAARFRDTGERVTFSVPQ